MSPTVLLDTAAAPVAPPPVADAPAPAADAPWVAEADYWWEYSLATEIPFPLRTAPRSTSQGVSGADSTAAAGRPVDDRGKSARRRTALSPAAGRVMRQQP